MPILTGAAVLIISSSPSHAALVSLWNLDDTSSGVATDRVGGNNATWQNGSTNLANVAVWDNALNANQVAAIYPNGLASTGVPEPGSSVLAAFGVAALMLRRRRQTTVSSA